jgi:hypothetical protein
MVKGVGRVVFSGSKDGGIWEWVVGVKSRPAVGGRGAGGWEDMLKFWH